MKSFFAMAWIVLIAAPAAGQGRVELRDDPAKGQLQILVEGREAAVYQYGAELDMVHYYPVRSASGKLLTVQQDNPYPHHRSFWFGDFIQLDDGLKASFYMPFYSQVDKKDPKSPFADQIRHVKFLKQQSTAAGAEMSVKLLWVAQQGKAPMIDEVRSLRIVSLGGGEYFLDCRFKVTAAYGDVKFLSDPTHYAWPYIRMHPQFAVERTHEETDEKGKKKNVVEKGTGTITNSAGQVDGKATFMQPAQWVDYSGTVDGVTEGLAAFADPQQPDPKWFTRDYGTFGPRRPDQQSGKPFVLKRGDSLQQRIGVLVHRGDVTAGRVAERYRQFAVGKL